MLALSRLKTPDRKYNFTPQDINNFFTSEEMYNDFVGRCERYRETNNQEDKENIEWVYHAYERNFWIDFDGNNHKDGNLKIDFEIIASLVPHIAWYLSPSGKGMKMLVEIDRDYQASEYSSIRLYLLNTISEMTGLKLDYCRTNISFASDFEVHYSDGIFHVPEIIEKKAKKTFTVNDVIIRNIICSKTSRLSEILADCPETFPYSTWFAVVMSALKLYGEDAIPLLEAKWDSQVPYTKLLTYADNYNFDILEVMWNNRIRKNLLKVSYIYSRRIIAGATGSGKSKFAIDEIDSLFQEHDNKFTSYVIYIVPSVDQAVVVADKLYKRNISYEILVSSMTFANLDPDTQLRVSIHTNNQALVKIIQLASLKNHSCYRHIHSDYRRLYEMYIDELTLTDFVRPSLCTSNLIKAYLGINVSDDVVAFYDRYYSPDDLSYAKRLIEKGDESSFVSSILFQKTNTTVISTEELTIACLEKLHFKKIHIREEETKSLKETCTLHVSKSSYYVSMFVESPFLKKFIRQNHFVNIFANKCEFATDNLVVIKGQHLPGKNLSIIRHLPRNTIKNFEELFVSCFKDESIKPVALYYKDMLMQAVGRSVGFRGSNEAYVMVHSTIWSQIEDMDWIYAIDEWKVAIDNDLIKKIDDNRYGQKKLVQEKELRDSIFWKKEKNQKIKSRMKVTGKDDLKLYPKDVKHIFGTGYTLKDVAEALDVSIKNSKNRKYLVGIELIL